MADHIWKELSPTNFECQRCWFSCGERLKDDEIINRVGNTIDKYLYTCDEIREETIEINISSFKYYFRKYNKFFTFDELVSLSKEVCVESILED